MKLLISEFMDETAVDSLRARFKVSYEPALADRRADLLGLLGDADALIVRNRTRVDAALLHAAPSLRVIGRLGVGLDNIDEAACAARGIEVILATGANALSVAEYVICTAMLLLRGAYSASSEVAAGAWPRTALSEGRETAAKTLGIVGFGAIGQLTAKLAHGLGMRVLAHDALMPSEASAWRESRVKRSALGELLRQSDVVSLHVPLSPATRDLINAERIANMKPDAIVINTSRGGIVSETALAAALRDGHLGGAALDVFDEEPLKAGSPLAGVPNLILTPHIAGVTRESNRRVSSLVAEKVGDALDRWRAA